MKYTTRFLVHIMCSITENTGSPSSLHGTTTCPGLYSVERYLTQEQMCTSVVGSLPSIVLVSASVLDRENRETNDAV